MKRRSIETNQRPELDAALADAKIKWQAMTFEEQEIVLRCQRQSHAKQDKD